MPSPFSLLRPVAERNADRLALISDVGTRTYEELVQGVAAIAYTLREHYDLQAGDALGLWGFNSPEWAEMFLACGALGVSCVPLNTEWTAAETAAILHDVDVRILVHDSHLAARAQEVQASLPSLTHLIDMGPAGGAPLAHLRSRAPQDCLDRLSEPPEGSGRPYFFTSGTSGSRSKLVIRAGHFQPMPAMDQLFDLSARDRVMCVTPFFHGNGNAALLATLRFGGSLVFPRRFAPTRFWNLVDFFRPGFLFTVMPIVNFLMAQEPTAAERNNALTKILALGISPRADAVEKRFGVRAFDWYGGTEIGGCVCSPMDEPLKPGATGKVLPGKTLFILNDHLEPCPPGEVGQIAFLREEIAFGGYANDPEATASALAGPYFLTGDLGYLDAEGWFFFVDRVKDMVRRGGENISSLEVETVLGDHPDIAEIAIVPRPDPLLGERVTAFVVAKAGHPGPDVAKLRSFARNRLSTYKLPDLVLMVPELPRTQTGKIRKVELKRLVPAGAPG